MKNTNSTGVLACRYRLVNHYSEKWSVIIEHNSKHLISVPNEWRQVLMPLINKNRPCYGVLHSGFLCSKHLR